MLEAPPSLQGLGVALGAGRGEEKGEEEEVRGRQRDIEEALGASWDAMGQDGSP
jgi:hypothetical protein